MQPLVQAGKVRTPVPLTNSDVVMNDSFWIGLYPGLGEPQLEFVAQQINEFVGGGL
jgi:CDP-6-deoxy-D-xylo-4-hexulose-3-dehydrase